MSESIAPYTHFSSAGVSSPVVTQLNVSRTLSIYPFLTHVASTEWGKSEFSSS